MALSEFLTLIVGASIALISSVLTARVNANIQHEKAVDMDRIERQTEALETLVKAIYENLEWLESFALRNLSNPDHIFSMEKKPIKTAIVIADLYFPTLAPKVREIDSLTIKYITSAAKIHDDNNTIEDKSIEIGNQGKQLAAIEKSTNALAEDFRSILYSIPKAERH